MTTRLELRLIVVVLGMSLLGSTGQAALRGGSARVNITPPLGLKLIGSKGQPSDAILDELYARALVLSDGRETLAIVSVDLLYAPLDELTNPVRVLVREQLGIAEQNVMVCATHTHSGPEVFTRSKLGPESRLPVSEIDQGYLQVLVKKLAGAVRMAQGDMCDVRVGTATGQLPEVLYNRRPRDPNGQVQMAFTLPPDITATRRVRYGSDGRTRVTFDLPDGSEPLTFGPVDPDVFILRAEDPTGRMVGSLVSFGCHPVCVYPFLSTSISADYPGHAVGVVEKLEGGVCLFALGLAGNTVPIQRDVGPCRQIGRALGAEAVRRLQFVATTADVTLAARRCLVAMPTKDTPPQEIVSEIQVLRVGDTYILGLPGEVLVEVGLAIKDRACLEKLWITTATNDTIGYICHTQAYDAQGYEPVRGTHLAQGAGEIVIDRALALLEQMKEADLPDAGS